MIELAIVLLIVGLLVFVGLRRRDTPEIPPAAPEERFRRRRSPTSKPFDRKTASAPARAEVIEGPAYIVDGDTVKIRQTQIRLFGIDAPELDHPFGRKAKWALHGLCKGQVISAEVVAVDDHDRTVAKCRLPDGRDLSAEMVKVGLAIDWPKFSGGQYTHLEPEGIRKKLWLADARQKGRMKIWEDYEARKSRE